MKTKFSARLLSLIMVIALVLSSLTTVMASSVRTNPYGFIWQDDHTGYWNIQYYTYNNSDGAYSISDRVTLNGNTLYDKNGNSIATNVASMSSEDRPTVVFKNSTLYFVLSNGKVGKMTSSISSNYYTSTSSTAKYFVVDSNDIGTNVKTSSGSSVSISSLSFSSNLTSRNSCSTITSSVNSSKASNRVEQYVYDDDRIAYEAYKAGKSIKLVICKDSNIWVETSMKLLSKTCVGAKFVGYTTDYSTLLYDQSGYIYYYTYSDSNYTNQKKVKVSGVINSFNKDSNGFITGVVTSSKTISWSSLISSSSSSSTCSSSTSYSSSSKHVTNSSSKSVAYNKNGSEVARLVQKSDYLYWTDDDYDSKKLSNSYDSDEFGITSDIYPVWINDDGDLYEFDGDSVNKIAKNVRSIKYDSNGYAYKYTTSGGSTYEF